MIFQQGFMKGNLTNFSNVSWLDAYIYAHSSEGESGNDGGKGSGEGSDGGGSFHHNPFVDGALDLFAPLLGLHVLAFIVGVVVLLDLSEHALGLLA